MANNIVNVCPAGDNDGSKIGKADKRWSEANVRAVATTEITFEASNPANTAGKLYFKNNKLYFNGIQLGAGGAGGGLDEDQVRDIAQQEIDAAKAGIKADIIAELDVPTQIADAVGTAITNLTNDLPDIVVLLVQENNEIRTEITALIQDVIANSDIVQNAVEAALAGDALQNAVDTAVADLLASEELASVINNAINTFADSEELASVINNAILSNAKTVDSSLLVRSQALQDKSIMREQPALFKDQIDNLWRKITLPETPIRTIVEFLTRYPNNNDSEVNSLFDQVLANALKAYLQNNNNLLRNGWDVRLKLIVGPRLAYIPGADLLATINSIISPKELLVQEVLLNPFLFDFVKSDDVSHVQNVQVNPILNVNGVRVKKFADYPQNGVFVGFENTPVIEDPLHDGEVWLYRLATSDDDPSTIVNPIPAWQLYDEIFGNNCSIITSMLDPSGNSVGNHEEQWWQDTHKIYSLHLAELNARKALYGNTLTVVYNRINSDFLDFEIRAMSNPNYTNNAELATILTVTDSKTTRAGVLKYAVNLSVVRNNMSSPIVLKNVDVNAAYNLNNERPNVGTTVDKDGKTVGKNIILPIAGQPRSHSLLGEILDGTSNISKSRLSFGIEDFDISGGSLGLYLSKIVTESSGDLSDDYQQLSAIHKLLLNVTIQAVCKFNSQISINVKDKASVNVLGSLGVLNEIALAELSEQITEDVGFWAKSVSVRNLIPQNSIIVQSDNEALQLNKYINRRSNSLRSDSMFKGVHQQSINDLFMPVRLMSLPGVIPVQQKAQVYATNQELIYIKTDGLKTTYYYYATCDVLPFVGASPEAISGEPYFSYANYSMTLPQSLKAVNLQSFVRNALFNEFPQTAEEALRADLADPTVASPLSIQHKELVEEGDLEARYYSFTFAKSYAGMFSSVNYLQSSYSTFLITDEVVPQANVNHEIIIPLLYGKNFFNGAKITVVNAALVRVTVTFQVFYPSNIFSDNASESDMFSPDTYWVKTFVQDAKYLYTQKQSGALFVAKNAVMKVNSGRRKTFICAAESPADIVTNYTYSPPYNQIPIIPMLGYTIDSSLLGNDD